MPGMVVIVSGMNFCRTCKHWAIDANGIGIGFCGNLEARMRSRSMDIVQTAQNFGCPMHEDGECDSQIYSDEECFKRLKEFVLHRYDISI